MLVSLCYSSYIVRYMLYIYVACDWLSLSLLSCNLPPPSSAPIICHLSSASADVPRLPFMPSALPPCLCCGLRLAGSISSSSHDTLTPCLTALCLLSLSLARAHGTKHTHTAALSLSVCMTHHSTQHSTATRAQRTNWQTVLLLWAKKNEIGSSSGLGLE